MGLNKEARLEDPRSPAGLLKDESGVTQQMEVCLPI
jgi:hypothetical protein